MIVVLGSGTTTIDAVEETTLLGIVVTVMWLRNSVKTGLVDCVAEPEINEIGTSAINAIVGCILKRMIVGSLQNRQEGVVVCSYHEMSLLQAGREASNTVKQLPLCAVLGY